MPQSHGTATLPAAPSTRGTSFHPVPLHNVQFSSAMGRSCRQALRRRLLLCRQHTVATYLRQVVFFGNPVDGIFSGVRRRPTATAQSLLPSRSFFCLERKTKHYSPLSCRTTANAIIDSNSAQRAYRNCRPHFHARNSSGSSGRGPNKSEAEEDPVPKARKLRNHPKVDTIIHANEMQNSVLITASAKVE